MGRQKTEAILFRKTLWNITIFGKAHPKIETTSFRRIVYLKTNCGKQQKTHRTSSIIVQKSKNTCEHPKKEHEAHQQCHWIPPQKNGQTLGKSQKATIRQGPWAVSPPKPPKLGVATVTSVDHCSAMVEALGGWDLPRCTCTFGAGGAVGGCWTVGMGMLGITSPEMVIEYDGLGDFMQFSWLWMGFHAI